ncbi:hypothetical protein ACMSZT_002511 [Cronobacter dublinensis]
MTRSREKDSLCTTERLFYLLSGGYGTLRPFGRRKVAAAPENLWSRPALRSPHGLHIINIITQHAREIMANNGILQGMPVSETVFIEKPTMMCNHFFIIRKITTACLFLLVSWALLHLWLILIHSIDERVAATLLSSPIIFISIGVTVFSVLAQKQAGVAQALYKMTLGLVLAFIILIMLFSMLLNTLPDLNDLVFYYECFLVLFFTGSPLYLFIRML